MLKIFRWIGVAAINLLLVNAWAEDGVVTADSLPPEETYELRERSEIIIANLVENLKPVNPAQKVVYFLRERGPRTPPMFRIIARLAKELYGDSNAVLIKNASYIQTPYDLSVFLIGVSDGLIASESQSSLQSFLVRNADRGGIVYISNVSDMAPGIRAGFLYYINSIILRGALVARGHRHPTSKFTFVFESSVDHSIVSARARKATTINSVDYYSYVKEDDVGLRYKVVPTSVLNGCEDALMSMY